MKTRYAVFAVIFAVSILISIQAVEVVDANPFPIPWPSTPNQEKPALIIKSPQNYTLYNDTSVPVDLTVITPYGWNAVYFPSIHYVGELNSVNVYLDGNLSIHYTKHQVDIYSNGNNRTIYLDAEPESRESNLSVLLNQTAPGVHILNITALSYTYNVGQKYPGSTNNTILYGEEIVNQYPIVLSDIVNFTVQQPEDQTNFLLSQTTLITLAIVIVILVVASVSLVYFRRRKKSQQISKT